MSDEFEELLRGDPHRAAREAYDASRSTDRSVLHAVSTLLRREHDERLRVEFGLRGDAYPGMTVADYADVLASVGALPISVRRGCRGTSVSYRSESLVAQTTQSDRRFSSARVIVPLSPAFTGDIPEWLGCAFPKERVIEMRGAKVGLLYRLGRLREIHAVDDTFHSASESYLRPVLTLGEQRRP